jgi:hypothetical protein
MNPEYRSHLGLFRFFASVRRLYDDLRRAEDQLKVQKATAAEKERELREQNAELLNRLLQKNFIKPIEKGPITASAVAPAAKEIMPSFNPLELMNERQNDNDLTSKALAMLHAEREKIDEELFVKRGAEILSNG